MWRSISRGGYVAGKESHYSVGGILVDYNSKLSNMIHYMVSFVSTNKRSASYIGLLPIDILLYRQ